VFLDEAGLPLNHIKPHGMWASRQLLLDSVPLTKADHAPVQSSISQYILMQTDEAFNDATMRAIKHFNVPLYGLPNTLHQTGAAKHGIPFIPEAFVDLNYSNAGHLLGVAQSNPMTPEYIYGVTKKLGTTGVLPSVTGEELDIGVKGGPFSVCIHSDFEKCVENLKAARRAVDEVNAELYTGR
jgi:UPF0271 protein